MHLELVASLNGVIQSLLPVEAPRLLHIPCRVNLEFVVLHGERNEVAADRVLVMVGVLGARPHIRPQYHNVL